MTYGIISLDTGNALAWYSSDAEAFAAARKILEGEPEAIDNFGVAAFDETGRAVESWTGNALVQATHGVPA